jgi:hypothetical protein
MLAPIELAAASQQALHKTKLVSHECEVRDEINEQEMATALAELKSSAIYKTRSARLRSVASAKVPVSSLRAGRYMPDFLSRTSRVV